MKHLKIGDQAPTFTSVDQDGKKVNLSDYEGKKVVFYFYPKDNTPGCTIESCDLRDNYNYLLKQGYEVIGVSADSEKKHRNFIKKFKFLLIIPINWVFVFYFWQWLSNYL